MLYQDLGLDLGLERSRFFTFSHIFHIFHIFTFFTFFTFLHSCLGSLGNGLLLASGVGWGGVWVGCVRGWTHVWVSDLAGIRTSNTAEIINVSAASHLYPVLENICAVSQKLYSVLGMNVAEWHELCSVSLINTLHKRNCLYLFCPQRYTSYRRN